MRTVVEVDFPSPELARAALKAFETRGGKAEVNAGVEKNVLRIEITAGGFSALRARTTSALRDLKIISDALELKKGLKGGLNA